MADLKISQLSSATALAGTEVVPVVQGGSTKKATIDQILAPASGKGIDFSAAGGDILTIYDEGTWTPTIVGTTTAGTATYSLQEGTYTRIGRQVTVNCAITWSGHTGTGFMRVNGLPFTSRNDTQYSSFIIDAANLTVPASSFPFAQVRPNGTQIGVNSMSIVTGSSSALAMDAAASLYFQATYFV